MYSVYNFHLIADFKLLISLRFWKKLFDDNMDKCVHTEAISEHVNLSSTYSPKALLSGEYVYCDCSSKDCVLNIGTDVKDTIDWKDCLNALKTGKRKCVSGLKLFRKCYYDICRVVAIVLSEYQKLYLLNFSVYVTLYTYNLYYMLNTSVSNSWLTVLYDNYYSCMYNYLLI